MERPEEWWKSLREHVDKSIEERRLIEEKIALSLKYRNHSLEEIDKILEVKFNEYYKK